MPSPDLMTIVLWFSNPAPVALLLEPQPVVLEIDQQRLVVRSRFERRRRRRHLQPRPGFAVELQSHGVDCAQRFRAADRIDRAIEHGAGVRLRALRDGFRIVSVRGGRREQDKSTIERLSMAVAP